MNLPRNLTWAAASSLLAIAGCASTHTASISPAQQQLASSAQTLDDNARVLAARADTQTPGFAADAHELEQRTYDLRTAAASGRTSDSELRADFNQVTRSYQSLRDDVQRLDTPDVNADLALVDGPYRDVASRMSSVPGTPGT
jgi:hypothetical protein